VDAVTGCGGGARGESGEVGGQVSSCHFALQRWQGLFDRVNLPAPRADRTPHSIASRPRYPFSRTRLIIQPKKAPAAPR